MGRLLARLTRRRTQSQICHLTPADPAKVTGLVRRVFSQLEREFGLLAPPVSLHAVAPEVLAAAWLMLRETLVATGTVPRAVKEALATAVSGSNTCPYCVEVHGTALGGLVPAAETSAIMDGHPGEGGSEVSRVAAWGRSGGRTGGVPAFQAPELIGTAVTFHYLNRMVNVFLVESPIPPGLPPGPRRAARRLAGALLRPVLRRGAEPGGSLDLLPPATLPPDLGWAAASPSIAEGFARAAASIELAGRRSVPAPVRELVLAELAGWNGEPPTGPGASWVRGTVASLAADQQPAGRLALLTALSSYQVGESAIDDFRRYQPSDRELIETCAWASWSAARWWGRRLWRGGSTGGSPPAGAHD